MCFLESIFVAIVIIVIVNYAVDEICDKLLRDKEDCECNCTGCCCKKCEYVNNAEPTNEKPVDEGNNISPLNLKPNKTKRDENQ